MKSSRPSFKAGDIPTLVLVAVILGGFLYLAAHPEYENRLRSGNNFGPEWQCTQPGRAGSSFCIKKSFLDSKNQDSKNRAKAPN